MISSPFAKSDAELVGAWLRRKYGLVVAIVEEATPTPYSLQFPVFAYRPLAPRE